MKHASGGIGVALLAVLCCAGPFLVIGLVAAAGSLAVIAGGAALAAVVALALALVLARRALLRQRGAGCAVPKPRREAPPANMG